MSYVLFLGMFQGLLIAYFCFLYKDNNRVGFIALSLLLLSFSLVQFEQWIFISGYDFQWLLHIKRSTTWMPFLFGPCFYWVCRSLIVNESKFRRNDILHFVPAIIHIIYLIPYYFSGIETKFSRSTETPIDIILIASLKSISMIVYLIVSRKLLIGIKNRDHSGLINSLCRLLASFFICILIVFALFLWEAKYGEWIIASDIFAAITISLFIIFSSLLILIQWKKFAFELVTPQSSNLSIDETLKPVYQEILNTIAEKQLYKDQSLKIEYLASELQLPMHYVSLAINNCSGMNFQTLINHFRINHVKKELKNSTQRPNILNIAYNSGFNSKASFNRAFKQFTQQTPLKYWQSYQSSNKK